MEIVILRNLDILVCHFPMLLTINSLVAVTEQEYQECFYLVSLEHLLNLVQWLCDSGFVLLWAER